LFLKTTGISIQNGIVLLSTSFKVILDTEMYYETFKYSKPTTSALIQPLNLSLPISAYCDLVADSVESLLARVKKLTNLPQGSA